VVVRELGVASLTGLVLSACLSTPATDRRERDPAADLADAAADLADAAADPADAKPTACDSAFAVAYVDRLSVAPGGGTYVGVLVIEALGSKVNLDELSEGPDDGIKVELELSQPAYENTPAGLARGFLAPEAESQIIGGGLIDDDAWDASAPTFQLRFDQVPEVQPPVAMTAFLSIGDSRAVLEFDIRYENQELVADPLDARRVESACSE
jgi:hypothetical protein